MRSYILLYYSKSSRKRALKWTQRGTWKDNLERRWKNTRIDPSWSYSSMFGLDLIQIRSKACMVIIQTLWAQRWRYRLTWIYSKKSCIFYFTSRFQFYLGILNWTKAIVVECYYSILFFEYIFPVFNQTEQYIICIFTSASSVYPDNRH